MRSRSKAHSAAGFTLVEALIVMGIMSIVMLAVMSFYVPAHRSTITQTQVADVQSNLRLAMDRMTKDILMAGFLIENPEATPAIVPNGATSFTIQTRMVGHGFARVQSNAPAGTPLTIANAQMTEPFLGDADASKASKVRLFDPLTAREIDPYGEDGSTAPSANSHARLYNVADVAGDEITLAGAPTVPAETVVILAVPVGNPNPGPPPLQTIVYRHEKNATYPDGVLLRIINGTQTQLLARGLDDVNFVYHEVDGRIRRIDITLTGQTRALNPAQPNDLISGAKTRSLQSSVKLRNV